MITVRPPRYLLREYAVRRLLCGRRPGRFLEIGYGGGQMLVTLARLGFTGVGYEISPDAQAAAASLLASRAITAVDLVDRLPEAERFDWVFLFEVLGYLEHPLEEMRRYRSLLSPGGQIIFSFVRQGAGYSPEVLRNMRTFSATDVDELLVAASLRARVKWNYGFPLANLMRPAMNTLHRARLRREPETGDGSQLTGLYHTAPAMLLVGALLNDITVRPWAALQMLFKNTDLGNGYLVAAEAA
jgi:SAM-dependent methyltransferase